MKPSTQRVVTTVATGVGAVAAWEVFWWARRAHRRTVIYNQALERAQEMRLPLVVVGAPDRGATRGPGCGDLCLDIGDSICPRFIKADIGQHIPLQDDSAVVFVSCVLEYVEDYDAAMEELQRVSGGRLYIVRVEPWTLTAYLYPGAKRTIPAP